MQAHKMKEADIAKLKSLRYPDGLITAMAELSRNCAQQIFIIDNSAVMKKDGGIVLKKEEDHKPHKEGFQDCTRWEELSECVRAHIRLSAAFKIPSSFRFLNDPSKNFGVCQEGEKLSIEAQVHRGLEALQGTKPHGAAPLANAIFHLTKEVEGMKEELSHGGRRVSIILCTDGVPSDTTAGVFVDHLKLLEGLPVQVVVRLCTNEPSVVDFYNTIDKELKLPMDVLDDFQGEAVEICKVNPWLTYALPIHRAREMGFNSKVLDLLDETALTKQEMMEFCKILFGKDQIGRGPEAGADWEGFKDHVKPLIEAEQLQWDPIEEEQKPLVDFSLIENPGNKMHKMRKMRQKLKLRWLGGGIPVVFPVVGNVVGNVVETFKKL